MYCSHCGKKVTDTMLFCPFCGDPIVIPDQDDAPSEAVEPSAVPEKPAPPETDATPAEPFIPLSEIVESDEPAADAVAETAPEAAPGAEDAAAVILLPVEGVAPERDDAPGDLVRARVGVAHLRRGLGGGEDVGTGGEVGVEQFH